MNFPVVAALLSCNYLKRKKEPFKAPLNIMFCFDQTARVTLPERKQRVQA